MPIKLLKNIKRAANILSPHSPNQHVSGVYVFSCKDLKSNQPLFNDGIPSLIFMPSLSNEVVLRKGEDIVKLKPVWLCCGIIQDTQWQIPSDLEYIIVVRFNPASFYSIFDLDPTIFQQNPICSFEDIVADKWKGLIMKMYQKKTITGKMNFLNNALSNYKASHCLPHIIQLAVGFIEQKRGNLTVSQLVGLLGGNINYKWLQRNFVRFLGMTPKKYISLQRFIYTYTAYEKEKTLNLIAAPVTNGYYDYNHFFKDFKQYLGVAPSQYVWD